MRKIAFRYNLLRGGAYYARLRALQSAAPTIRMSDSGEIKMSLTGTFAAWAHDWNGWPLPINWLTDEIQPILRINSAEYPLGVYLAATSTEREQNGVESIAVEAYDRCWRVRDTRSDRLLYWPAGTLYLDAVEQLLNAAGINTVFKTPSTAAFTEPREDWDLGVSHLTVVNELLQEINYKPLWFDARGNAVLEPVSVPTAESIKHTLDANNPDTRLLPEISRETDIFSAPNKFIVTCANPDKSGVMVSTAANENPQSPLSIQRRGRTITTVRQVNNIASQDELDALAAKLRNESMTTGETVRVSTGLLPGWGVADVVALHYGSLNAVCIEHAFDMTLAVGGRMNHILEKVVYNLDA